MIAEATPDAALVRWVQAIPAVRCVAPPFRAWTRAKDAAVVPVTTVAGERFGRVTFGAGIIARLTLVAGGGTGQRYWLARVPSARIAVLHAGSEAQEESFTAVIADVSAPPRAVAALPAAPRLVGGLHIGSGRAAVEAALGAGHAKTLCDYEIVRYQPRPQEISESEMWFFYRAGVVVAIARYEAV